MSLRLRLGLSYGALTGVVVLLVCVLMYAVHSRSSYDDLDRALVGAAQHLVTEDATIGARAILPRMLAVPIAPEVAVRIYGPTGQLLTQAPNAPAAPAVDPLAIEARGTAAPFDPLAGLRLLISFGHHARSGLNLLAPAPVGKPKLEYRRLSWQVYLVASPRSSRQR